ncbi:hypothetical protein [Vibrio pectenicida]|uniref:Uncharacterized protein n=1 Tax=Vibrio pectenicida TaxID=62763 RepID=A0A3R9FN28_9VIBR|nr:hypothetical protein [Vibrio pectenicida]RSD30280.1 hypothetical protein EJA03_14765 [Vibrio pectenicida]
MKLITSTVFIISLLTSGTLYAADYGVELAWNTNDVEQILETLPNQRAAFGELIKQGDVKDMFVVHSKIDGKPVQLLKFVLEADNEASVENKLKGLPMYKKELVKISNIRLLGSKWLDSTPVYNSYGVIIRWKEGIEPLEMDRVLGIDLQRVISLNQAGLVTSSYLDTQELSNGVVRPIYSISFLAKDAQHARELSSQFEAVALGYTTIEVQHLGRKINLHR